MQFTRGTCTQKCPEDEINMREKHNLLHRLEMVPGTERSKRPKADHSKAVKLFRRSSAGQETEPDEKLRTFDALVETVYYLLHDVIYDERYSWRVVYDFIMDRLRSVRQDVVIQDMAKGPTMSIFQPIIRFYSYAGYRLCEEPIANYDPFMNNKHLQECLKKLLGIYDDCDLIQERSDNIFPDKSNIYEDIYVTCRSNIESVYILHNLGNAAPIVRCLKLNKKWRIPTVDLSLHISLSYLNGNWVTCCKLIRKLPSLLAAVASLHLPAIRRKALLVMSTAYNSSNLFFPIKNLQALLLYQDEAELINDLQYYNIPCKDGQIQFNKHRFDASKKQISPKRQHFVEEKFDNEIHEMILVGWI